MKTWFKYNLLLFVALLVGVSAFLSPAGSGVSIRTEGGLSLTFVKNEAQAASVTTLGAAADKAGTSPWTALSGLSITSGDTVIVVSAGDSDSTAVSVEAGFLESVSYGGTVRALTNDGTNVYAGGATTQSVRKYLMSDLSYDIESSGYGGTILALTNDGTYVYAAGSITQTVKQYTMSNLWDVTQSADYGGVIYDLTNDGIYVYAGGDTTQTVRKYYTSNMTLADESADYGGVIYALTNDGTYVYAAGSTTQTVRKYYASNMTLADESVGYGGSIFALTNDGTNVYAGGATNQTVQKYLMSDMSYIGNSASYGGTIYALIEDGTNVYAGGDTTQIVRKYLMSDMSYVEGSVSYGGTIWGLTDDGADVYVGGATTLTIRKYFPGVSLVKDATASYAGQVVTSVWSGDSNFTGAAAVIRITNTSTAKAMTAVKVSGLAASPFDLSSTQTGTGTTSSSGATATLSQADEVVIGAVGNEDEIDDMTGSWTTGAGYVSGNEQSTGTNGAGDASNINVYSAAEIVSATTAQTAEVTGTDNVQWAAAVATYKVASAAPDISNAPSGKAFGVVNASSSYWSEGSEPSWPLDDTECFFNVTNSSGAAVDITIVATNFTGGVGWTLVSGSPGEDEAKLKAGKSGDANEAAMVTVNGAAQSFISSLGDGASLEWELKLETGSFTDGVLKETVITLTATLS